MRSTAKVWFPPFMPEFMPQNLSHQKRLDFWLVQSGTVCTPTRIRVGGLEIPGSAQ